MTAGGAAAAGWAAAAAGLAALGILLPPYPRLVVASGLVRAIACLGLDLVYGHAGLLSLGHAAYFGTGAYAGAFLVTFFEVSAFETYLVAGVVAATVLAALGGLVCVRATRLHFAILTLAYGQVVHALFEGGAAFRPFGDTGKGYFLVGHGGLYIPRLRMAGVTLAPEPFLGAIYGVVAAAFLLTLAVVRRVRRSPFGLALRAIRESDTRAASVGLAVRRYRWAAFVVSGTVVGLAGALAGQLDRQVTPEQLHWLLSARLVLAVAVGGRGHPWGPVAGAALLTALEEAAHRFPVAHRLVLGALLIGAVWLFPGGVAATAERWWARLRAGRLTGPAGGRPGVAPTRAPARPRPRGGGRCRPR